MTRHWWLVFILMVGSAHATMSVVQSAGGTNCNPTGSSVTCAFGANTTINNIVAFGVLWTTTTTTLTSVTGCGVTMTIADNNHTFNGWSFSQGYGVCSSAATTITYNFSASSTAEMVQAEISGGNTGTPLDNSLHGFNDQASPGTGTDAITSPSETTTKNGDLIWGWSGNSDGGTAPTSGTGYTQEISSSVMGSEHKVQGTAGSVAATFTDTQGTAHFTTGIMPFQPAGAASSAAASKMKKLIRLEQQF